MLVQPSTNNFSAHFVITFSHTSLATAFVQTFNATFAHHLIPALIAVPQSQRVNTSKTQVQSHTAHLIHLSPVHICLPFKSLPRNAIHISYNHHATGIIPKPKSAASHHIVHQSFSFQSSSLPEPIHQSITACIQILTIRHVLPKAGILHFSNHQFALTIFFTTSSLA